MRVELRHFTWVIAVAEELHFGRAADRLGMSRQSLSNRIRAIEAEVGYALFFRTTRQVVVTPAGEAFIVNARKAVAYAERAHDEAQRAAARG